MTDTIHEPTGGEGVPEQQSSTATPTYRRGPAGFGNGPILASGVMVGGAMLFAGWGIVHMVSDDGGIVAALGREPSTVQPADDEPGGASDPEEEQNGTEQTEPEEDGTVTVPLPDRDHDGMPDVWKVDVYGNGGRQVGSNRGGFAGGAGKSGRGDRDRQRSPKGQSKSKSKTRTYMVKPGDTLEEISGETGVAMGRLVKKNSIQHPGLIYAGASLLISPVN